MTASRLGNSAFSPTTTFSLSSVWSQLMFGLDPRRPSPPVGLSLQTASTSSQPQPPDGLHLQSASASRRPPPPVSLGPQSASASRRLSPPNDLHLQSASAPSWPRPLWPRPSVGLAPASSKLASPQSTSAPVGLGPQSASLRHIIQVGLAPAHHPSWPRPRASTSASASSLGPGLKSPLWPRPPASAPASSLRLSSDLLPASTPTYCLRLGLGPRVQLPRAA